MATKRIQELTLRSDFDATCNVPVDDSTQSFRTTGQQIKDFILAAGNITRAMLAQGAVARRVTAAKTTTYPITTSDDVILCSGSAFTVTLPTAVGVDGRTYTIRKTDSSATNIITIATTSAQTIDGLSNCYLYVLNDTVTVMSDGSNWVIVNQKRVAPAARYTSTAGQSIANGSTVIVDRATKDFDTHAAVTTGASWKFTCPVGWAGRYVVQLGWAFSGNVNNQIAYVYKNGSNYARIDQDVATTNPQHGPCAIIDLAEGDYFDFRIAHSEGSAKTFDSVSTNNYIVVTRLP